MQPTCCSDAGLQSPAMPASESSVDTPARTSIRSCRGAFKAEWNWDTAYDRSHDVASVQGRPWQAIRQRSKLRRIDRFACLHHRRQQRIWLDAWLAPCPARRLIAVGAGRQLAKRFAHPLQHTSTTALTEAPRPHPTQTSGMVAEYGVDDQALLWRCSRTRFGARS